MNSIAILVTHNPDQKKLKSTISSLKKNKINIILIDNTPSNSNHQVFSSKKLYDKDITYLPLNKNTGIANAQNIGIRIALDRGYDHIILSDQDTIYPDNFLDCMLNELNKLRHLGKRIAAIGPAYIDENKFSKPPFFVKYNKGKLVQISQDAGVVEVSQLISSGTLITAEAIRETGMMNSDLFIDWVDMDWCWRAIRAGFTIYGTFNVRIHHQLGDYSQRIGKKTITIHSPFRNYFIVRNGLHLAFRGSLLDDKLHRRHLLKNIALFYGGMIYISDKKLEDLKMMTLGIIDAIRKKLGPLQ